MSHDEHLCGKRANEAVVNAIVEEVARRKMKVTALSAAAGIPRSTLHNKFSRRAELTVAELVQLSVALDLPVLDLLITAAAAACSDETSPRPTTATSEGNHA